MVVFLTFLRWVEEDPIEILRSVHECIEKTTQNLLKMNISLLAIKGNVPHLNCSKYHYFLKLLKICVHYNFIAIGITNQRETTVVWDKSSGQPLHNAIGVFIVCNLKA